MNNSIEGDQDFTEMENKFQQGIDDFADGEMENALEVFVELVDHKFRIEECLEYISRIQFELFEYEGMHLFS
jgi:hypothetical protein